MPTRTALQFNKLVAARKVKLGNMKLRKPPKVQMPISLERQYKRALRKVVNKMTSKVMSILENKLPSILDRVNAKRPTLDSMRLDDTPIEDIKALIKSLYHTTDDDFDDSTLSEIATEVAAAVAGFNKQQIINVIQKVVGVDPFIAEPYLQNELSLFVATNVDLVTTVQDRYLSDIQSIVMNGARNGLRYEEISATLQDRTGVAQSNADRIARDQVNKFNGQLNGLRQKNLGISSYTWQTVGDGAVRDEHVLLQGTVQDWDSPPSEGHPGEAINCRCWAEPIINLDDFGDTGDSDQSVDTDL